jgi:hypothetical protein
MLSIANKLFMLSFIMLSVMALRQKPLSNQFCHCADECLVVFIEMLIVVKPNVIVLNVVVPTVFMFCLK